MRAHSEAMRPSSWTFFGCVLRFLSAVGVGGAVLAGGMVALGAMLGSVGERGSLDVGRDK